MHHSHSDFVLAHCQAASTSEPSINSPFVSRRVTIIHKAYTDQEKGTKELTTTKHTGWAPKCTNWSGLTICIFRHICQNYTSENNFQELVFGPFTCKGRVTEDSRGTRETLPSDFPITLKNLKTINFVMGPFSITLRKFGEFDFVIGGSRFVMVHHLALSRRVLPLPLVDDKFPSENRRKLSRPKINCFWGFGGLKRY